MKLIIDDSAIIGAEYHNRILTAARFAVRELDLDQADRILKFRHHEFYVAYSQHSDTMDIIQIPTCANDIRTLERLMKIEKCYSSAGPLPPFILEKSMFHEFGHMFQTRNGMMSFQGSPFIRNMWNCFIMTWQESDKDQVRWFLHMRKSESNCCRYQVHELTQKEVEQLGSDGFADNVILRPAIYKSVDKYAYDAYRKLLWEAHADKIADELYEKFNRTAN